MQRSPVSIVTLLTFAFLLFALIASCGSRYRADTPLANGLTEIDHLLDINPDSAYRLLERYDRTRLRTPRDSALFQLLWAEGRDKTFHHDTIAADITCAVDFFRNTGDRRNLNRALFCQGRIYQNAKLYSAAIISFREGLDDISGKNFFPRGKLHAAIGDVAKSIGDWTRMERESQKACEYYELLDSTALIHQSRLAYAYALSHNNKTDSSLVILKSLYKEVSNHGDTAFLDTIIRHLITTHIIRKDYYEARKYLDIMFERGNGENMEVLDLNYLLLTMVHKPDEKDSIKVFAEKIADRFGQDKISHEYYASTFDYKKAYDLLLRDYNNVNNLYSNIVCNNANYLIHKELEAQIIKTKIKLRLERQREIMIIAIGLIPLLILCIIFVNKIQHDKRKIKDLLASVSMLSRENKNLQKAGRVEVPLLRKIFASLDLLYSEYYRTNEKERKGILEKMGEEIELLRNDDDFLKKLELEINRCCDNILDDVYADKDKLTVKQRRLVAYLYFGLSTETICILLQTAPGAYYSRKSRLLDRIGRFTSTRKDELIKLINMEG